MEKVNSRLFILGLVFVLALCASFAGAGTLDPPAGPDDPASAMHTIDGVYNMLDTGQAETKRAGAFAEPSASHGDTGRTLDEVYAKAERLGYLVSRFVVVRAGADAAANGAQLLTAYAQAKTLTPAVDNRIGVFISPGQYDLETSELVLDTDFVDLYGLSVNRVDQHIKGAADGLGKGVIRQTASDVRMENLLVLCTRPGGGVIGGPDEPAAYYPAAGVDSDESPTFTFIKNCEFKDNANSYSTRLFATYAGQYEDCFAGNFSFGYQKAASGTFTNCTGGVASFGYAGTASGTFTNCIGGSHSFGYNGTASGTFTNCTGEAISFGAGGIASGIFTNCTGGDSSFGWRGSASGTFTNCTGGLDSFGGGLDPFGAAGTASGTFTGCIAGEKSFGITASGTFTDCTAGEKSFGFTSIGEASGTFVNCTGGRESFGTYGGPASGTFTNCIGGSHSFGYNGPASGTFINCTGGVYSFGSNAGTASGTFICCDGGAMSFDGTNAEGVFDNCKVAGVPYAGAGIIVAPASVCP